MIGVMQSTGNGLAIKAKVTEPTFLKHWSKTIHGSGSGLAILKQRRG